MNPEKPLQMIAVADIGRFALLAFENPDLYIGKGLELAGDELTEPQIAEVMSIVIGRSIKLLPAAGPPLNEDMAKMVQWFNEKGYEADIPALQALNNNLMTLETWLRENNWV